MDIQKQISELQERNEKKFQRMFVGRDVRPESIERFINQLTTDSFNQGALTVIDEVRKVQHGTNGEGQKWVMMNDLEDHLKTLEDKIKDV